MVQEIKDVDRDINVDEIVQMEEKLDMKPKAEGPVTKAVSFSEKVEDMEEGETLRRNPLPAEAPESIGGESSILKPPSLSQKQSEAFLETEGSKTSQEDSIILDDASESVPWEMYRYIQKEEREEEDTDFEEYDGQKVGDGKSSQRRHSLTYCSFINYIEMKISCTEISIKLLVNLSYLSDFSSFIIMDILSKKCVSC